MKKVLLSLIMCACVSVSYAQKAKKFNAKAAAKVFCACTTEFASGLHPTVVTMMHEMATKGEKVAEENFKNALIAMPEPERNKVMASVEKDIEEKGKKFNVCIDGLKAKYGDLDEKQRKKMIAKLDKMKGCELADEFAHMMDKKK